MNAVPEGPAPGRDKHGGVDGGWEVGVAPTAPAAHEEPPPHHEQPLVHVQERDAAELLAQHDEDGVEQAEVRVAWLAGDFKHPRPETFP